MRTVGHYEILDELGRGGMAVVYRARHTPSGDVVALKELTVLSGLDRTARARFLRTAQLAGGLAHPNVVAVGDVFEHDGTPYVAMEYLERGSLRAWLPTLTVAQLAGALEGVLSGLAGLARHGIVHRDLKPENLLVSQSGAVKIGDFALAKLVHETWAEGALTPTGAALGTPGYMAPEQATAGRVDPRTDLYSLGCIAYEALVGRVPFHDPASPMAMLYRRVNEEVPAAASVVPSVAPELSDWVARLLAREPARRTESAVSAWRELEAVVISRHGPEWRALADLGWPPPGEPISEVDAGSSCPQCGASTWAELDFCERCGEYLRWEPTGQVEAVAPEAAAPHTPTAVPPPPPAPASAAAPSAAAAPPAAPAPPPPAAPAPQPPAAPAPPPPPAPARRVDTPPAYAAAMREAEVLERELANQAAASPATPSAVPITLPSLPAVEAAPPVAPSAAAPAPPPTRLVRRTPHLDFLPPPPLTPGSVFEVTVYADEGPARAGEEIEEVVVRAPSAVEVLELDVWLVTTHHFLVTDAPIRRISLPVDKPHSGRATFRVAVVAAPSPEEEPVITASLSCNGRPSGRVTRVVPIASSQRSIEPTEPAAEAAVAPTIEVDLTTVTPDLTIEIAAPENDGRRFEVRIDTPLLPLGHRTESWFLPLEAGEMVARTMEHFFDRDATARARLSSLRGAGLEFFDAAPQLFKDVYWRLVDEDRPPRNVFIVSDERSMPWELMIPSRRNRDRIEEHEPLGVQMAIGRWHRQSGVSPRQRVPLASSVVVAPQYSSSSRLEHAAAEAEFVCRNFGGITVEPASFDNLDLELERAGADLLHFVCHGEADEREQLLLLEEPDKLYARQIRAMPGLAKACRERKPFVFLNACELGRQGRGLSAASGFAKSFIEVDAACVVGTLWSVDDMTAHGVAMEFYEQVLREPGTPFAEALRRIRARGYEAPGEDSWAAYCFYGDPAARLG